MVGGGTRGGEGWVVGRGMKKGEVWESHLLLNTLHSNTAHIYALLVVRWDLPLAHPQG